MKEKKTSKKNKKKINVILIIFIIITIITIYLYPFKKTETDYLNEKIKKQNGSWIAKDISKEIMEIPYAYFDYDELIDEEDNNFYNNFEFYEEKDSSVKKNNATGLLFLSTKINNANRFKNEISWEKYITNFQSQTSCGSCSAFSVVGALEAYVKKTQNLELNFSEQYLISYSNFKGCSGEHSSYYLDLISLKNHKTNIETLDYFLKQKIHKEISNQKTLLKEVNPWGINTLKTKTQLSFQANEVPLGIPLENQVKYLAFDSCEIINSDKKMNLSMLLDIYNTKYSIFDENFCEDISDSSKNLVIPKKRDDLIKYFIEDYITIDNSDCKKNNSNTVNNIKKELINTPIIATMNRIYPSFKKYGVGVWEKINDEEPIIVIKNNKEYFARHAIIIVGWGTDSVTKKEYWLIKNNWGTTWGENGFGKVWINDPNIGIECSKLYGFSGKLITKSGKEINDLLPIVYEEIETKNKRNEEIERKYNEQQKYQNVTPDPFYKDPFKDIIPNPFIDVINYQPTENLFNNNVCLYDCINKWDKRNCIGNKLKTFFNLENEDNDFI